MPNSPRHSGRHREVTLRSPGAFSDRSAVLRRDPNKGVTWRFHRLPGEGWRWQRIVSDHAQTSSDPCASYEECLADAEAAGYRSLKPSSGLVSLTLVSDPEPIPASLRFTSDVNLRRAAKRSAVLKKRVAHPAIERVFGKPKAPTLTRKRAISGGPAGARKARGAKRPLHSGLLKTRTHRP